MWYDLFILAFLVFSVIRGAQKGIVWQLATISAVILCFAFAETASLAVAPMITVKPPLNRWIAMFGLYMLFALMSFGAARQLKSWLEKMQFVEFDRHLGAVLGFVKGSLIALVATFFVVTLSESLRDDVLSSNSGRAAAILMNHLHAVMPQELHAVLDPYLYEFDHPDLHIEHDHELAEASAHPDTNDSEAGGDDTSAPPTGDPPATTPESDRLSALVADLIGVSDRRLIDQAVVALQNTQPEHRRELLEKLATRIPGVIRQAVSEWQNGKPEPDAHSEVRQLLSDISALYFDFPNSQRVFVEETQAQLATLDESTQLAVLRDLYADLIDNDPDPDPTTDFRTSLQERIDRQLAGAQRDPGWDFFRR